MTLEMRPPNAIGDLFKEHVLESLESSDFSMVNSVG